MRLRATAVVLLLTTLSAVQPERVTASALYAKARLAFDRGADKNALALAREGQAQFGNEAKWRELFMTVGVEARARMHEPKQALAEIAATPPSNDPEASVRRLMAMGFARGLAESGQGDAEYAAADALALRVRSPLRAEIALRRATPAFYRSADLAEQYARQALHLVHPAEQPYVFCYAHGMVATAAMVRGEYQRAIEHFDRVARLARALDARGVQGRVAGNSGWAFMQLGDSQEAALRYDESVRIAREDGDTLSLATFLGNRSAALLAQQHFQEALPAAEASVEVARKLDNALLIALALDDLTQVEIELGAYDAARRHNNEAKNRWAEGVRDSERRYLLLNDARIDAATGLVQRALSTLSALAETTDDAPLRWNAQAQMASIYETMGRRGDAERMYEAALDTGDRARVDGKSDEAYLLAFESLLIRFYDDYIDFLLHEGRTADALRVAERSRARTLLGDHALVLPDPTTLARAQDAAILEYWLAPRRSLLWVITRGGISIATLPPGPLIDREIDAYRNEIMVRGASLDSVRGARLFQTLIAPALPYAHEKRFIVIPDGHLGAINVESLIGAGKPHYWIEDAIVSYAPALALVPTTKRRLPFQDARALIIGDIPSQGAEFPALPQAGEEVADVARHFGRDRCRVVTGESATRSAYLAADLRRFSYVHFVAHGTASVHSPFESSVVLAGGRLSADQIIHAPMNAELVTVSSCSSASGRLFVGEGPVGLAWAFLRAGARRVVASQWDVSDSATSKVMNGMYGSLAQGRDHADALREAKLALARSNGKYSRPVYWAPFILYGAP